MLELSDKDSKAAIIKMLKQVITKTTEPSDKIDNLNKEIEKNINEILEPKNIQQPKKRIKKPPWMNSIAEGR